MKKILLIMLLTLSLPTFAADRALIVGLGEYADPAWAKINGDNDLLYVRRMLVDAGYTDITSLANASATKEAIVGAINDLARRCRPGDKVYFHFSGHGQLITDLDGDEALRRNDASGWEQSLVPYDAYMSYCDADRGEKHISDDELSALLATVRRGIGAKGELVAVIDACHSGDATMSEIADEEPETVRGIGLRFSIPRRDDIAPATAQSIIPEQWLTVSACRPFQLCTEIKGKNVGKLTYVLYKNGIRNMLKLKPERLQERLAREIELFRGRLPQNPMVSGSK